MTVAASRMLLLALIGALTLACGAVRPPARNPLAEPPLTPTVPAPAGTAFPPVVTSTPTARGDSAPPPAEVEPAVARATALLAEWLALPPREFTFVAGEALVWPSSCLGVEQPGVACAGVQTPGFRVRLRDGLGGVHSVHLAADGGGARWAGEQRVRGVLTSLDWGTRRAVVAVDGAALSLRLAPGTLVGPGARAGVEVTTGYDPAASASGTPVAAWLVVTP